MKATGLRTSLIGGLLALLLLGAASSLFDPAAASETSAGVLVPGRVEALSAQPTPTYVSELAPAVSIDPWGHPVVLPATGIEQTGASVWPRLAGVAFALVGCLFIYAALSRREPSA
ncbi:MAG: hypothetical protein WBD55_07120 [Dehalococcoidia bacterium]